MNTIKKIIVMLGFLLAAFSANAQKNLNIEKIFENYGKQDGSILIELAQDVLKNNTKINRYKSMIIDFDSQIADLCTAAIEKDVKNGNIMMELKKDGKTETAYYCLSKNNDNPNYEYILFTNKNQKITLIYLRGVFEPKQLEKELNELQSLFIKVNNKRIKL
ncbi:MAG: hypothetical protein LBT56_03410 [Prevotellaceae bacterium]|jgi:hypothetical protein|nr:hypothetical protein [Prevotellaceae bacterium]